MKKLYIIGAGGLGRELYSWITLEKNLLEEYSLQGFLDDDLSKINNWEYPHQIVGTIKDFNFNKKTDYVIISIASNEIKKSIVERLEDKVNFISYISSTAIVATNSIIGKGVVIMPGVVISCNTIINDYTLINLGSQIGHDVNIGKYNSIMANVIIGGEVVIGASCFLGSSSNIIPRIIIADKTTVGIGSTLIRSVKGERSTYFGNPAKRIL